MAKVIDESLKKQLSKKMVHFLKYFPVRIKNVGEDAVAARNLIWHSKTPGMMLTRRWLK